VEGRAVKEPRPSDLKESGGLEQDADIIILINRPEKYHQGEGIPDRVGEADLIVSKNRSGQDGRITTWFRGDNLTFSNKDS
jgi:replicative DNA helicase